MFVVIRGEPDNAAKARMDLTEGKTHPLARHEGDSEETDSPWRFASTIHRAKPQAITNHDLRQ